MSKTRTVVDLSPHPAMSACRVLRVDACNAVCMVDNPACNWATPYGNYCEHPLKDRVPGYDPGEAAGPCAGVPH